MVVALARHLLALGQQRLDALAQLDQRVALVGLLDDAGDQLADAVVVLVVHHRALGLADPLVDDLLGGLGGDAAEVLGGDVALGDLVLVLGEHLGRDVGLFDHAPLAGLGVDRGLGLVDLVEQLVFEVLGHEQFEDAEVAGLAVEFDARVLGRAGRLLVGREQRVFERVHQGFGVDPLLALEQLDCVNDFLGHVYGYSYSDLVI